MCEVNCVMKAWLLLWLHRGDAQEDAAAIDQPTGQPTPASGLHSRPRVRRHGRAAVVIHGRYQP